MVGKQNKPHADKANGGATSSGTGTGKSQRKSTEPADHWAFLDEFEAPMWVDLNLECRQNYEDKDDEWFHASHLFHQCDTRQLIAAFSHSAESCKKLDFNVQMPSSVSRSRGDHYRGKETEQKSHQIKQHPVRHLNDMFSSANMGYNQVTSRIAEDKTVSASGSSSGSSLTDTVEPNGSKSATDAVDLNPNSISVAITSSESNSSSTVTFEGTEEHHSKSSEISSQAIGQTSTLLSVLRVSLRKSCVTRQASRVEVHSRLESVVEKSTSYKSIAGSVSNPGPDGKKLLAKCKDTTACGRNVRRQFEANGKANVTLSKASSLQLRSKISNSTIGSKGSAPVNKTTNLQAVRENNQNIPHVAAKKAKETMAGARLNGTGSRGNKNASGISTLVQKSSTRDNAAGGTLQDRKVPRSRVPQDREISKSMTLKARHDCGTEAKKSGKMVGNVYFR